MCHYRKHGFIHRSKSINKVFIYAIGVERVCVEHVVNLCHPFENDASHMNEIVRCVIPKLSSVFSTA
jgi:hypothetical protein